jgi:hypothetical protein
MRDLSRPEVLRCFFDDTFQPPLPAMELRWDPAAPGVADRMWHLPEGVGLRGPAPSRFGITIQRDGDDAYHVRLLWNDLCLSWRHLRRVQIVASSLTSVLGCLGTDLWHLLHQPINSAPPIPALVA